MSSSIGAVFFDFGGTLFSYTAVHGRAFFPILMESLERLGVEAEPAHAGRAYRDASRESFLAFNPKPYYLHRELFEDTYRRFALALGAEADRAFIDWFYDQQREMFYAGCALREDCLATLSALRDADVQLAIVSNIDDDYLVPMVEKLGLAEVLHDWTSSEEARSCKPHDEIFRYSMRKAGVDDPARVLFVGDSAYHDVAGAREVGMRTALIQEEGVVAPGSDAGSEHGADHVIEALSELVEIVRR